MFLDGLKFGIGFYLGIVLVLVGVATVLCLATWIYELLAKPKRGLEEHALRKMGRKRTSTSVSRGDGTIQSFSFCSVIRWDNEEDRKKRRHRDGVR